MAERTAVAERGSSDRTSHAIPRRGVMTGKLVWKLSLALTLSMSFVLSTFAFLSVQQHIELFLHDKARDGRLVGHAIAAAFAAESELHGEPAARRLLSEADARDPDVTMRWVEGMPERAETASLQGNQLTVLEGDSRGIELVVTYTPVRVQGRELGAIEISESLSDRDEFIATTISRAVLTVVIMLFIAALVSMAAGSFWVGRPVARLLEKVRQVANGELRSRVVVTQNDELGELAEALNDMSHKLEHAREEVDREHTERLQTEAQLRHAERLSTVGRLASGVAHEIGTPLNVIAGHAGLIAKNDETPETASKSAMIIRAQAERISTILRHLLDFARQTSRVPETKEAVELVSLISDTLGLLETLEQAKNVDICFSAPEEELETLGDPAQLQQVFINLCMNGMQAMVDGGSLSIEVAGVRARPPHSAAVPEGDFIRLSVEDQGEGIEAEHLPHIFEPFFTTKDVGEGTGLGLSMAYGIVHELGGWFDVESRPGEGARFTVYLPRQY